MLEKILRDLNLFHYLDKIENYIEHLILKNREINLFSRKITKEVLIKEHIVDCLLPYSYFANYNSITDLGTGGGLPGVLLAIIFPDKNITLIEKSPKKVLFLEEIKKSLNLKNVQIILNNVENIDIKSQVVTCRAFKSIYEIISLTKKFFNSNGIYILYKGRIEKIKEEISECKKINIEYNIYKIENDFGKERHIVICRKC
ncbi:MAG TPA: 16S rRNA (guanine(527)-N(7))-methyltransferase RsmG [Spirochaetota bacterium]|nr:16S rRNA (guanine(527)-N(7))-methyltransferase RsmG [Spirochaetota bacterium]HOL56255.1 16S rRNA (guanine(527)-N(7))-methyltransferase RsmG [Spirochaetota bacterium]HPP04389.1 16S rRNA (guanine(527)-N(7))-methyltransferase RsmG [Spirochaetota bacterium]